MRLEPSNAIRATQIPSNAGHAFSSNPTRASKSPRARQSVPMPPLKSWGAWPETPTVTRPSASQIVTAAGLLVPTHQTLVSMEVPEFAILRRPRLRPPECRRPEGERPRVKRLFRSPTSPAIFERLGRTQPACFPMSVPFAVTRLTPRRLPLRLLTPPVVPRRRPDVGVAGHPLHRLDFGPPSSRSASSRATAFRSPEAGSSKDAPVWETKAATNAG